ncbi:MAG: cytochrome c [Acidimicrobiia bacterium]|nr:cytochrome c [Acidimicrobiia bacterium]
MTRVFTALVAALWAGSLATTYAQDAREREVWDGVYTAAQAARGKERFATTCSRCHNNELTGSERGPALKGDDFLGRWKDESLGALFTLIRDTMPRDGAGVLADDVKVDVLAFLLEANRFPAGPTELTLDPRALEAIAITSQPGARAGLSNFALVQVVGCLAQGPGGAWLLQRATDPVATRDEEPTAAQAADAGRRELGGRQVHLLSASGFTPAATQGQKMDARGLLYRDGGETLLNLTSLRAVSPTCAN